MRKDGYKCKYCNYCFGLPITYINKLMRESFNNGSTTANVTQAQVNLNFIIDEKSKRITLKATEDKI
jgi:hypothetical protein